jgi:homogentisate phytyltransferase/homogentisate geranylgeranyltransferase
VVSVSSLYALATSTLQFDLDFSIALISAISTNFFITGYNQWVDVELDKITKPNLPLASGALTKTQASWIIRIALALAIISASLLGMAFLAFILLICVIGFFYSYKNVYFKKHHLTAAMAILAVRGVMVNVGFYLFFKFGSFDFWQIPAAIWILTLFVVLFSLGIAWFKDIPDRKGDSALKIQSLVIRYGVQRAFNLGAATVLVGYAAVSLFAAVSNSDLLNTNFLFIGNSIAGVVFIALAFLTKPEHRGAIQRFYKGFWVLFALEYLIFALSALV